MYNVTFSCRAVDAGNRWIITSRDALDRIPAKGMPG
jgi:hypothetical protein